MNDSPIYNKNWCSKKGDGLLQNMIPYGYYRLRLDGVFVKEFDIVYCLNDEIFCKLLEQWNVDGDTLWKYWSAK